VKKKDERERSLFSEILDFFKALSSNIWVIFLFDICIFGIFHFRYFIFGIFIFDILFSRFLLFDILCFEIFFRLFFFRSYFFSIFLQQFDLISRLRFYFCFCFHRNPLKMTIQYYLVMMKMVIVYH
jgi:hypothetical protein